MRIIDFHTHVFPDELAPKAVAGLSELGGIHAHYDGTVSGLIAAMDRAGVDVSVLAPVATKASQVRTINDWSAGLIAAAGAPWAGRLVPFGAMHPAFDDPAAEIARIASLGLRGIKLHPEYQEFEPNDPRMDAVYRATVEQGLTILYHAGEDEGPPTLRGTAEAFAMLLDRWPDLRIVLAHMGGFRQWGPVAEHLAGRDVCLDTSYTLGHLPDDDFVALVRAHGAHRVVFGSDGPWTDAARELAHLRRLPFTADELEGIVGGNAERLLAGA